MKSIKLKKSGLKALSSVCTEFTAVFLASLVIPAFTGAFDLSRWPVLLLGVLLTVVSLLFSVLFAQKGNI